VTQRPVVPIVPAEAERGCAGAEPFALMVLGDSMAPEFAEGDVIVVEPDGLATDGAFVVAQLSDGWSLRQLRRDGEGWTLRALDPRHPPQRILGLGAIRGVVIQKRRVGRRAMLERYVE
jgi:SOS-response transcriptional repressor LexA